MDAVLLDCLGTLLELRPPGPRLRIELERRAGVEVAPAVARAAFRAEIDCYLANHLEGSDAAGLERLRDRCAAVLTEALGLGPETRPVVREAMLAAIDFVPYDDALTTLQALSRSGVRLVVVSNWDCSLGDVLDRAGLAPYLHGVVASAAVGVAKPDAALFRAGLDRAGCAPARALFIGDSVENDVRGAQAAGLGAVLLRRAGSGEPVGHSRATAAGVGLPVIASLREAVSLI